MGGFWEEEGYTRKDAEGNLQTLVCSGLPH